MKTFFAFIGVLTAISFAMLIGVGAIMSFDPDVRKSVDTLDVSAMPAPTEFAPVADPVMSPEAIQPMESSPTPAPFIFDENVLLDEYETRMMKCGEYADQQYLGTGQKCLTELSDDMVKAMSKPSNKFSADAREQIMAAILTSEAIAGKMDQGQRYSSLGQEFALCRAGQRIMTVDDKIGSEFRDLPEYANAISPVRLRMSECNLLLDQYNLSEFVVID